MARGALPGRKPGHVGIAAKFSIGGFKSLRYLLFIYVNVQHDGTGIRMLGSDLHDGLSFLLSDLGWIQAKGERRKAKANVRQ